MQRFVVLICIDIFFLIGKVSFSYGIVHWTPPTALSQNTSERREKALMSVEPTFDPGAPGAFDDEAVLEKMLVDAQRSPKRLKELLDHVQNNPRLREIVLRGVENNIQIRENVLSYLAERPLFKKQVQENPKLYPRLLLAFNTGSTLIYCKKYFSR